MSKWILMPDSFKGTMSSLEICRLMREALLRHVPDAEVVSIPVADGGEGSVEAFLAAMGGHRVEVPCTGPDFRKISGFYGLLADGYTAVIEMAAAAGLPLMEGRLCAEGATTYGVGELILAAIRDGARRIILGLGGSATNDGGCGCAAALGVRFLDGTGAEYVPVGGTLDRLCRIDMSHRFPLLNGVEIVTMCDVDNPLCGPNGASAVFGPQKGATPDEVKVLDAGLKNIADLFQKRAAKLNTLRGAGAAGGTGAGVAAFLNGRLLSGIDALLDLMKFEEAAKSADLIITGEGAVDTQTKGGKVAAGIARRAAGKPVVLFTGANMLGEKDLGALYELGITAVLPILQKPSTLGEAMADAKTNLHLAALNFFRTQKMFGAR